MEDSENIVCPNCGYSGEQYEFVEHIDAPDLVGTFICPPCDHVFGEPDYFYSWRFD